MAKKIYFIRENVMYRGSILEPGSRCDFEGLKQAEINSLVDKGVIIDAEKVEELETSQEDIEATADGIIEYAKNDAQKIIEEAKAKAIKIVNEAEKKSAEIIAGAHKNKAEAKKILDEAKKKSARIIAGAHKNKAKELKASQHDTNKKA